MPPTVTRRDLTALLLHSQEELALERELVVPAPLVPGTCVVAGVVAGRAEGERRERRAGAGVAIRHDLRTVGQADELADALGRRRAAGSLEQPADLEVPRAWDVSLPRVALVAAPAGV